MARGKLKHAGITLGGLLARIVAVTLGTRALNQYLDGRKEDLGRLPARARSRPYVDLGSWPRPLGHCGCTKMPTA